MNDKVKVFPIFPTPLYVTTYEGDTTEIVNYFDSCEMNESTDRSYGIVSKNSYIIDNPICKPLTDFFKKCFEDFATNIMRYSYKELEFAQSWISHKHPGQFHKSHTHPNTLLAGVFYYDIQPDDASLCFSKYVGSSNRSYLEPSLLDDYQNHSFSQDEVYFSPRQNNFIIFPSYLNHGVPPNNTNRIRKSLGVNVLTKGTLGDKETISEIKYNRYV
jgi:uncharacterized protein (TIGR02466 family)